MLNEIIMSNTCWDTLYFHCICLLLRTYMRGEKEREENLPKWQSTKNFTHHWRVTCGKFFCKSLLLLVEQYHTRCGIWTRKWGLKYSWASWHCQDYFFFCCREKQLWELLFFEHTLSLSCYNLKKGTCVKSHKKRRTGRHRGAC